MSGSGGDGGESGDDERRRSLDLSRTCLSLPELLGLVRPYNQCAITVCTGRFRKIPQQRKSKAVAEKYFCINFSSFIQHTYLHKLCLVLLLFVTFAEVMQHQSQCLIFANQQLNICIYFQH